MTEDGLTDQEILDVLEKLMGLTWFRDIADRATTDALREGESPKVTFEAEINRIAGMLHAALLITHSEAVGRSIRPRRLVRLVRARLCS